MEEVGRIRLEVEWIVCLATVTTSDVVEESVVVYSTVGVDLFLTGRSG